jgi:3-methylcrotonyl-CoA carboxylase beta subunit
MRRLPTRVTPDAIHARNAEAMLCSVAELRERLAAASLGGGLEALARHRARGKLPVRERVERLADPLTPVLEFSALAAERRRRKAFAQLGDRA